MITRQSSAPRPVPITALIILLFTACSEPLPEQRYGLWQFPDSTHVSVRQSGDDRLRLRVYDNGVTRRFTRGDDGFVSQPGLTDDMLASANLIFQDQRLILTRADGETMTATRVPVQEQEAVIEHDGNSLYTRLQLPEGEGPFPTMVLVQGSGDDAATLSYSNGDFFVANGIAAVVYDKEGTGRSSGTYNHNFSSLADDVVAVVEWAAQQPGVDAGRIGVTGYSQGGWIAPLAASRSELIKLVIANYGMISSAREEERLETVATVARRGYSDAALAQVAELSDASIDIMNSNFQEGWEQFDALVNKYSDEAWMQALDGTTIAEFMAYPNWVVRLVGPYMGPPGLMWDYTSHDALDTLASRAVPVVWMIAEQDRSAPNESTLAEVRRRMAAGQPVYLTVFEDTDHGFTTFRENADGSRIHGNYHSDYFRTEVDWVQRLLVP